MPPQRSWTTLRLLIFAASNPTARIHRRLKGARFARPALPPDCLRNPSGFATLSAVGASQHWGCAMRIAILAFVLCSGLVGLCQSAVPAPSSPELHWLAPPGMELPGPGLNKPPQDWHFPNTFPRNIVIHPGPMDLMRSRDAQIDPKIVVHPSQSSLGQQPPTTLMAQNLYPGLQLMPICRPNTGLHSISIVWPNLKAQPTPTTWPKGNILPIETGPTGQPAGK